MKQLSNMRAQRILTSLRSIDKDDSVKFGGMVRMDIARNIDILYEKVAKFERDLGALHRGLQHCDPGKAPTPQQIAANNATVEAIEKLGEVEAGYELIMIDKDLLRLDDNPRITGDMIAAIAPILRDFNSSKEAAKKS